MSLILSEEQAMLRDTVHDFFAANAPVAHMRKLRDADDAVGFDRGLWRSMADLGLTGLMVGEGEGGVGLGLVEATLVAEQLGRNLVPGPFLASAVGAAHILQAVPSEKFRHWLAALAAGDAVIALAIDEGSHHNPLNIAMEAHCEGNGFKLCGTKTFVENGHVADLLIVAARTGGQAGEAHGLTLFAIEPKSLDLGFETSRMIDSSLVSRIKFDDIVVDGDCVIGKVDQGWPILAGALARLRTCASAELVGLGSAAADITREYLGQRKQFGVLIGSFQALQHRSAHLYCELQVAGAAVRKAARAVELAASDADVRVAAAKSVSGSAALLAVQEGVQMHGGVGMTDEYDIGFYMKRQRVLDRYVGDIEFQLELMANTVGY